MTSIGNDIVDLSAIDINRTQQKAFYSKILSTTEQIVYSRLASPSQIPFELFVWLLWSAKESVYKFAKRLDPGLVFSPTQIVIQCEPPYLASIDFPGNKIDGLGFTEYATVNLKFVHQNKTYYTRSIFFHELIATFASDNPDMENIHWGISRIDSTEYEQQSDSVRHLLLKKLDTLFPLTNLSVTKSPVGYPIILSGSTALDITLSFAHHGHYVAYAFEYLG